MYRVSPAEVSKAEGELIRSEGVLSALDAEFERKTLDSVELLLQLNEGYSQEKVSQLRKLAEEEGALQVDFYDHFNKKIEARKKWRQLFMGVLKMEKDLQGLEKFADKAKASQEIKSRIARLTGGKEGSAESNTTTSAPGEDEGFGPFEIDAKDVLIYRDKQLGSGAFGVVYRGSCRGKLVAVKELRNLKFDPKIVDDFRRECLIMRSLPHENILLFMGATIGQDKHLLITELAEHGSLQDVIGSKKIRLSFLRKMKMAREVAEGINWLHSQNPPLIHLDIKPANVLVLFFFQNQGP